MTTNQTMLAIFAFAFLLTTLISFYRLLGSSGNDVAGAQDGILATTIATSYLEIAQGLAFDANTDTSDQALYNVNALTSHTLLGPDNADEDSVHKFNDFDDFNRLVVEKEADGNNRRFTSRFRVSYVDPLNPNSIVTAKTFVKRLDIETWRSYPPVPSSVRVDTLRLSFVMGYFRFD